MVLIKKERYLRTMKEELGKYDIGDIVYRMFLSAHNLTCLVILRVFAGISTDLIVLLVC